MMSAHWPVDWDRLRVRRISLSVLQVPTYHKSFQHHGLGADEKCEWRGNLTAQHRKQSIENKKIGKVRQLKETVQRSVIICSIFSLSAVSWWRLNTSIIRTSIDLTLSSLNNNFNIIKLRVEPREASGRGDMSNVGQSCSVKYRPDLDLIRLQSTEHAWVMMMRSEILASSNEHFCLPFEN